MPAPRIESVHDIIDRANVGRATFYAHFDSKEDLLASGIETLRESLRQRQRQALSAGGSDERLFAFSRELFTHANEQRIVFLAMVGKRSGAVVQQLLQKMLVDLVRDEVKMTWAGVDNDTPVEAVSQLIGGGLFGLLLWWGNGKMRCPSKMSTRCSDVSRFLHSGLLLDSLVRGSASSESDAWL